MEYYNMSYTINQHIHLFSSWAASRAASVKNNRFKVEIGQQILSHSYIKGLVLNPDLLPPCQIEFNEAHKTWREEIIKLSKKENMNFTHGVSAKLINIYLKSIIICGGFHNHINAKYIHPPIDSVLLKELASVNFNNNGKFWRDANKIAWSNFDSNQYEEVIQEIKTGLGNNPLWEIEMFWKGFQ